MSSLILSVAFIVHYSYVKCSYASSFDACYKNLYKINEWELLKIKLRSITAENVLLYE